MPQESRTMATAAVSRRQRAASIALTIELLGSECAGAAASADAKAAAASAAAAASSATNERMFGPGSRRLLSGERRLVPAAAEGLDQQDAGAHAPRLNVGGLHLRLERRRLRRRHFEIGHDTGAVTVLGLLEGHSRGEDRGRIALALLLQASQSDEIVLDILIRGEHDVAVIRRLLLIDGFYARGLGDQATALEDRRR